MAGDILETGYRIVRGCVPSGVLQPLRDHCERMLERHKKWWADHR